MAQSKTKMLWENIHRGDLSAVHGLLQNGDINLEERDDVSYAIVIVCIVVYLFACFVLYCLIDSDIDIVLQVFLVDCHNYYRVCSHS